MAEKLTPARRRAMTREALLDAAETVFARRGFEGASLDEIAEAAGFTRGAIYKNFDGKEDLFFAVFDREIDQNVAAFRTEFSADPDFDPRNPEIIANTWRRAAPDIESYTLYLEFLLYAVRHPEMRPRYLEHRRLAIEKMADLIDVYARENDVRPSIPPRKMAAIMDAATDGFYKAMFLDADGEDLYGAFLELVLPVFLSDAPSD